MKYKAPEISSGRLKNESARITDPPANPIHINIKNIFLKFKYIINK